MAAGTHAHKGSDAPRIQPGRLLTGEIAGNNYLQSANYVSGSDGWKIFGNGDAEFNVGTFRGDVIAAAIHIPDTDTTANSFHVDEVGDMWLGCTESNWTADHNNANAYILNTGVAKFQSVTITGTSVAGFDVNSTTFTSGTTNIILDASNKAISINDATFGNSGIQFQYNSGTPRAYIGDGSTYFFNFDGTNISWGANTTSLSTAGKLTTTSAEIGGWVVGATSITDAAGVVGMSSAVTAGDDIRFWAGDATPGSAEFRVTEAGALTATSATITGSITATSGAIGGWTINATSIYTGTEDHSGYTANAGDMTLYSDGTDASIHAKNWYIDTTGALYCTSATVSGAITTTTGSSLDGQYLTALSVDTGSINNLAITAGKIANATITTTQIAANTIVAGNIAAATITTTEISNTAGIIGGQIANLTIAAGNIANLTITAAQIANATITGGKVVQNTITGGATGNIALTSITADNIVAATITGTEIAATTIAAGNIVANTITANEIAANTITSSEIFAGTITATEIATTLYTEINSNLPSDANLVGYWNFDEGEDLTASDVSNNSNDGTLTGTMTDDDWIAGVSGTALDFDGGDDYIAYGTNNTEFKFGTGDFSICGWAKYQGASGGVGTRPVVFGVKAATTTSAYGLCIEDDGRLRLYLIDDSNHLILGGTDTTLSDNEWHYVAVVIDNTNDVARLYVDASQADSDISLSAFTDNISPQGEAVSGKNVFGSDAYFNGDLDEIRVYNTALTEKELYALYKFPAGNKGLKISGVRIMNDTITSAKIVAGTITATEITVSNLSSLNADLGTITAGNITLDTTGFIRGGQTSWNVGNGFFLGYEDAAYRFSIGDASSNYFVFNGIEAEFGGILNVSGTLQLKSYTIATLPNPASNTGWKSPSATGETYNTWVDPTNAYASDDARANAGQSNNPASQDQDYYNFAFGLTSEVIDGIEVSVEARAVDVGSGDLHAAMWQPWLSPDGGSNEYAMTTGGTTYTWTVAGGESAYVWGSSTELCGRNWTASELSDANFRIHFKRVSSSDDEKLEVDHIKIKVYYHTTGAPVATGSISYVTDGAGAISLYDGSNWYQCIHSGTTNWTDLTDSGETSLHIHDARYYTETELNAGQLDTRYYTETEVDTWRSSVTQTEMDYLHGVTSDIQTQLNALSSLAYVEVAPAAFTNPAGADSWEDWDISSICPAGAKYAEVLIENSLPATRPAGIRKNGTATNRMLPVATLGDDHVWTTVTVELDANRVVERFATTAVASSKFSVVGYWI